MGATADGRQELIAVINGVRESRQSWQDLLLDLRQRGLTKPPMLAVGTGALGFWAAPREVFPTTKEQRCWVHKTANVLNKLPKALRAKVKSDPHRRTKGSGARRASLTMLFKLAQSASRRWRRINGHHQIVLVLEGKIFTAGVLQNAA